jgi:hypothetical protein
MGLSCGIETGNINSIYTSNKNQKGMIPSKIQKWIEIK